MLTYTGPHRQYGLYIDDVCIASADHPEELEWYWHWAINMSIGPAYWEMMAYAAIVDRHSGIDVTTWEGM